MALFAMSVTLIERLRDEADLCANEGADDIASLLNEAAEALGCQRLAPAFSASEIKAPEQIVGAPAKTFLLLTTVARQRAVDAVICAKDGSLVSIGEPTNEWRFLPGV